MAKDGNDRGISMINFKDLLIYCPIIGVGGGGGGGVTIKNQNKTITENGTYTADSGYTGLGRVEVNVQGGGATVSVDGENWADGTAVPSEGYIENVYVNTALSNEQVTEILSRLTYYPMNSYHGFDGDILFINNNRVGLFVERQYTGVIRLYGHCQSTNTDDMYGLLWSNEDGWNQAFVNEHNSTMVVNDTVSTSNVAEALNWTNYYEYTGTVGTQNALLTQLFSTTPFVKEQKTIQLTGNYDGSTIKASGTVDVESMLEEKKLPLKIEVSGGGASVYKALSWKGTAVPNDNTSYVENVYINNNLSIEEIVDLFRNLYLSSSAGQTGDFLEYYVIRDIAFNKNVYLYAYFDENGGYDIGIQDFYYDENTDIETWRNLFIATTDDLIDPESPPPFFGWNPNFPVTCFAFNDITCGEEEWEGEIYYYGEQNGLLSSLFSTTPFEADEKETVMQLSGEYDGTVFPITKKETINVKSLLEQKKLPLEMSVKIGSDILQWEDYFGATYTFNGNACCIYFQDLEDSSFADTVDNAPWANNYDIEKMQILYGTKRIPPYAFARCRNLTEIIVPNSVEIIGAGAFLYTEYITEEIYLPDSVTTIEESGLQGCGATSISIGSNVISLGEDVFMQSKNLKHLYYRGTIAQWNAIQKSNFDERWDSTWYSFTIHCTDGDITR